MISIETLQFRFWCMKHRPRPEQQDDLLRPRLTDMIDPRHELVKLATLIDWEVFEREWSGFFPSGKGRCSASTSLSGRDNHLGRFEADGVGVDRGVWFRLLLRLGCRWWL